MTTNSVQTDAQSPRLSLEQIARAVESADVPVLLMVTYQMTGDAKWLEDRFRPAKFRGVSQRETGDLSESAQREVRDAAVSAIEALVNGQPPAVTLDDVEEFQRIASFFLGDQMDDRHAVILRDELQIRAMGPRQAESAPAPEGFKAIIIGTGISGIVAMYNLQQLGIEFTVFERGAEAAGVWFQNTYPGAGVDTPSHLYSFSFSYKDWTRHYELRDELYRYFNDVLDELGTRDRVQFNTEVISARFDDETALWTVETRGPNGENRSHVANLVISTVGSLNQPVFPKIPGRESFAGLQFHPSNWPKDVDLSGKRVAIVGVGASCQQIAPEIAKVVDHLTIIQRSPQWIAPFDQFRKEISPQQRSLLESIPLYRAWHWIGLFWQHGDKIIEALRMDPEWEHPGRSINARNDRQRAFLTKYIESELEGRPDLIEKTVPDYPPFGKRMLLDNGWYRTLKRDNVTLLTDSVVGVDESGLSLASGERVEPDVIIWSTGYAASHFLSSLEVYGENGLRLREYWDEDDPRALLGVSIPHYPNFFMIGGPHSLPGSGSFMYFTELQGKYLRDLISTMFERGITALSATQEAANTYNDTVDQLHDITIWRHPGFSTYYRNSKGRVIFIMPFLNVEYWELIQQPNLDDFHQLNTPYVPATDHESSPAISPDALTAGA